MENTQEVTLRLDMDNGMVLEWLERLLESSRHPIYQNGIRVVKRVPLKEE
ncbi:hypothetical protein [Streptomyces cucumeris]|nr:hypothetical protein [Streptomyces sp. NEAU-Y11]MCP9209513.1 hypothetical protein [Streptomyces sp. NEAU-Y11]